MEIKHFETEYLTDSEAARFLKVSQVTLWRLRRGGKLPFYRIASKILYRTSELETFLQNSKRNGEVIDNEK